MESGKLLIYSYLPAAMHPADFEEISFEEFYRLNAAANLVREMRQQDIREAVGAVAAELLGEGE